MGYFYLSSHSREHIEGPQSMSTKELRRRLHQLGKSSAGARNILIQIYQLYSVEPDSSSTTDSSPDEGSGDGSHIEKGTPTQMTIP